MKVTVNVLMKNQPMLGRSSMDRLYERRFDWDAVPRVGDGFELDPVGGWSTSVKSVMWIATPDGGALVELVPVHDALGEGLELLLRKYGWVSA